MGIKPGESTSSETTDKSQAEKLKHDELLRNLDAQYQTARLTTHMQRGLGLGFNSQHYGVAPSGMNLLKKPSANEPEPGEVVKK